MEGLIDVAVPAVSFVLLVAVGMDLTADDFARVGRQRTLVLTGLLAPPVLLPALAVALVTVIPATPDTIGGLLLVASCPVGGMSNVFSYLARASPALSVTLTGLSCLGASVTIPLVSHALERAVGRSLGLSVPLPLLIGQLVLVIGLPLAVGVFVRHRSPASAARYRPALQRLSFVGVAVVLLLIALDDAGAFLGGLRSTVPLAAAFIVASWGIGWVTAALVTRDASDRFTIAVEFGTRHIGVAAAIAVTVLGRVEFAQFGATYFMTEVPLMLAACALFRRRARRDAEVTTRAAMPGT
jgi:BASS family bile acid:Na+ symporter